MDDFEKNFENIWIMSYLLPPDKPDFLTGVEDSPNFLNIEKGVHDASAANSWGRRLTKNESINLINDLKNDFLREDDAEVRGSFYYVARSFAMRYIDYAVKREGHREISIDYGNS